MTIEQLQSENAELKKDLKIVKNAVLEVSKSFGLIRPDGTFNKHFSIKDILGELTSLMQSQIMPSIFGVKKDNSFEAKIKALTELKPIYEKYKDL